MNQYTLIARKNIEKQYDSECTIYELKPKVINNITKDVETEVFKNEKCRISFEDIYVNTQTDTEAKKVQKIKLFIAPELEIKPGSLIIVTGRGRTTKYKNSGEPAVYDTHQEIQLTLRSKHNG